MNIGILWIVARIVWIEQEGNCSYSVSKWDANVSAFKIFVSFFTINPFCDIPFTISLEWLFRIVQLNQFETLERSVGCMNYKQFFHMIQVTGQRINLKLIVCILILLISFHFCWENTVVVIVGKVAKVFPFFYYSNF